MNLPLIALIAVLGAIIFLIDLITPLGVAGGVPYVIPVLMSLWAPGKRFTIITAAAATILTIAGFFLSRMDGAGMWMVLVNRFYALAVIWAVAILSLTRKELKERLIQLKATLDQSPDCACIFRSGDLRLIYANNGAARKTGYSMDELLQMKTTQILSGVSDKSFKESIKPLAEGKMSSTTLRAHTKRKNGEFFATEWYIQYTAPDDGDGRFIAFARDISEITRADMALKESEEKYRALFEAAGDAIFLADSDTGVLIDANNKAEELVGWTRDELIGMHQTMLHPPEARQYYRNVFKEHAAAGVELALDLLAYHKDGHTIPIDIRTGFVEYGGKK